MMNIKSLYLTKIYVKIPHGAREKTLKKAWLKEEVEKKWAESSWAKKLARTAIRTNLTDFDRFKLMRAKQARNNLVRLEMGKLKLKLKGKGKKSCCHQKTSCQEDCQKINEEII